MSNIEKDIKFIDEMVKEYNTFGDLDNPDYEDADRIYKAIENILAERKQDKARIQELEEENRIQRKQIMSAYNRGWIPKQKVKEKIEEIKEDKESKYFDTFLMARDINYAIDILEEILEDK